MFSVFVFSQCLNFFLRKKASLLPILRNNLFHPDGTQEKQVDSVQMCLFPFPSEFWWFFFASLKIAVRFFEPPGCFFKRHLHRSTQGGVADVRGELLALTTLAEMHRSNGEITEVQTTADLLRFFSKVWGVNPKMVGFPQQTHGVFPTKKWSALGVWNGGVPPL